MLLVLLLVLLLLLLLVLLPVPRFGPFSPMLSHPLFTTVLECTFPIALYCFLLSTPPFRFQNRFRLI